jgi:SAM-dependent methyltransferase
MRQCPACGGMAWQPFYESSTGRLMTGDQRIGAGHLAKIVCPACGVVANRDRFTAEEIELLYGEAYELNTLACEEHYFFTTGGPVARSQVFSDWIAPHIPAGARVVVEIGCGEGKLLEKLRLALPMVRLQGIDGSRRAAALGAARGLDIRQQLLSGDEQLATADVFLLINVIEHIEDIPAVIAQLTRSLAPGGRIIFCLPMQDYGGYDMFFAEHVWHFTVDHFRSVATRHGLRLLSSDTAHPINHGIGLFVCAPDARVLSEVSAPANQGAMQFEHLRYWEEAFRRADELLASSQFETLAVFGGGEVFTLFHAFTSLGDRNVVACIDDTKAAGALKHGIPVHKTEWLATHHVDALLLAVNKKYHGTVRDKVTPYGVRVYSLFT